LRVKQPQGVLSTAGIGEQGGAAGVGGVDAQKLAEEILGELFGTEIGCSGERVGLGGRRWRRDVIWVGRVGGGRFDETEVV
jgi:hypothetical protein